MRRAPNKTERLAAALLQIKRGENWLIPEPIRSSGDAKAICACVEWDHGKAFKLGGDTSPQNMNPLPPAEHAQKTKTDVKNIAKVKRLSRKQEEFRAMLLAKTTGEQVRVRKKSKPMAGSIASGWKKTFNRGWVRRDGQ
jgi:hypothetical protein